MSLAWDIDLLAAAENAPSPGVVSAVQLPPPAASLSKSLGTGGGEWKTCQTCLCSELGCLPRLHWGRTDQDMCSVGLRNV